MTDEAQGVEVEEGYIGAVDVDGYVFAVVELPDHYMSAIHDPVLRWT